MNVNSSNLMRVRTALLLSFVVAACAGEQDVVGGSTVFDTLGDTVVARTPLSTSAPAMTLTEEHTIREREGTDDYTFGYIADVAVGTLSDVFIWDLQSQSIRHYDSTGTFLRHVGRKGAGPGEYDRVNGMAIRADGKLLVWDAGNARVNVYSGSGSYESTWPAKPGFFTMRALDADTAGNSYLQTTVRRDTSQVLGVEGLVRHAMDGTVVDTLIPPEFEKPPYLTARAPSGVSSRAVPYFPTSPWTISPHGFMVAGPGDPYVVYAQRRNEPVLKIVRDAAAVPVDDAERAELRELTLSRLRQMEPGYQWSGPDIPSKKPAYRQLVVDGDARIWVLVAQRSERVPQVVGDEANSPNPGTPRITWRTPVAYDVFGADGRFLGHVRLPWHAILYQARGNHLWATTLDSLDVPSVTRFRIEPGLGASR